MMTEYNALSFDGDDYIDTASTISLDKNEFTLLYIGKLDEIPQDYSTAPLALYSSTLKLYSWIEFYKLSYGKITFWIQDYTNSESTKVEYFYSGSEPLRINMYGIRWNEGNIDAIINENIVGSGSNSNINVIASDYEITRRVGTTFDAGYNSMFKGKLYIVLIYSRALSDSEIQAIYNDPMNPPTDGLVLFYAPDSVDTANGKWLDKSGNGNDGTIYGASYVQLRPVSESTPSASLPYGLYFDGVDDYITPPVVQELTNDRAWTIGIIFYYAGEDGDIIGMADGDETEAHNGWWVNITSGDIYYTYEYGDGSNNQVSFDTNLTPGWHVLIIRRTTSSVELFLDDAGTSWIYSGLTEATGGSEVSYFRIFTRFAGTPLKGKLALVAAWGRTISDDEVSAFFNDPNNPPKDGLVLWFSPESLDTTNGKWLNRAEILNTGLVEQLDGTQYGTLLIPVRWTT
ncbi:MAG: hypothetical protein H0Z19_11895, partial [Archaeoglobus sp.]